MKVSEMTDEKHSALKARDRWDGAKWANAMKCQTMAFGDLCVTYRVPISTPFPSPPSAAPDLTAGGITPIPTQGEAMRLLETILPIAQNEPEKPTENNTMSTLPHSQVNVATPAIDLPPVGSRWAILSRDGDRSHKVTIKATGPQGVMLKYGFRKFTVFTPSEWSMRTKSCMPGRQPSGLGGMPVASHRPGFIRRFLVGTTKAAFWTLLGVLFKTPLTHAAVGGIAYLTGLLSK